MNNSMKNSSDIKETFLSTSGDGTFNFIILFKNGKVKHKVKKFRKVLHVYPNSVYQKLDFDIVYMTCNYFTSYMNDMVKVVDMNSHYLFFIIQKGVSKPDMCFTIKK